MSDKQYYAMIDGQRRGPLSADELIEHGTVASTPIWCDGMADWTTASQVDAISTRLPAIPQPPVYRGMPTVDAMAYRCPATQAGHVGLGPGFVDEDQPAGVESGLVLTPVPASVCHVGTILLGRVDRLFLKLIFIRFSDMQMADSQQSTPSI